MSEVEKILALCGFGLGAVAVSCNGNYKQPSKFTQINAPILRRSSTALATAASERFAFTREVCQDRLSRRLGPSVKLHRARIPFA